jgi:Transport and Golgi organisation 2
MCTVTIVPLGNGFRLCCNRDERRNRPTAAPPMVQSLGQRQAIFPIDPTSQGTWVGVNDAGLTMALLNRTADQMNLLDETPEVSRGRIIPALLTCGSADEALEHCARLDAARFDRFRLLIMQGTTAIVVTSDTRAFLHDVVSVSQPVMWTSSSLGDDVVEGPRRELFNRMFDDRQGEWLRAQRRFHRHQWRTRPQISVMMERSDARTVSQTAIDVRLRAITLTYRDVASPSAQDKVFSRKIER